MKQPHPDDLARIESAGAPPHHVISPALIGLLLVGALTTTFVLQNRDRMSVHFLMFNVSARTWASIAIAIVLGGLLDRLVVASWSKRRERRRLHD